MGSPIEAYPALQPPAPEKRVREINTAFDNEYECTEKVMTAIDGVCIQIVSALIMFVGFIGTFILEGSFF